MIPAAFDYVAPQSVKEAIGLLEKHGDDAKILAGGHSLLPLMKLRPIRPPTIRPRSSPWTPRLRPQAPKAHGP